ncbi:MAG TPA: methyltransferase domain-containing protein [Candidatus Binataceae bacterium]|nr:methyltransferase domain-containing protein [Candidatus Binataceae bacterium]
MNRFQRQVRVKRAPRPAPQSLHFGPNQYIAQTQPGFEAIATNEILARVPHAHEVGQRIVPERCGMAIFSAPDPSALVRLRCAEDIFALVGYRAGPDPEAVTPDRIRAAARDAPLVEAGILARVRFDPKARGGRRLRYRVVARQAGEHEFRRVDLQHAVERGISERTDHTWRHDDNEADVEFWATMFESELLLAVRLSSEAMRHRDYKVAHRPASLRPAAAAALGWLSGVDERDVVLDPFCGAGTILIERAGLGRYAELIGSDRDSEALAAARLNVGPRYKPIRLEGWDAAAIPLTDSSVTKIVTNLPWGIRYGTHGENRKLYPAWIAEFNRVLAPGGRMVLLSAEWTLMRELAARRRIRIEKAIQVAILGARASIFICAKT